MDLKLLLNRYKVISVGACVDPLSLIMENPRRVVILRRALILLITLGVKSVNLRVFWKCRGRNQENPSRVRVVSNPFISFSSAVAYLFLFEFLLVFSFLIKKP